jgi:hypothetical protein
MRLIAHAVLWVVGCTATVLFLGISLLSLSGSLMPIQLGGEATRRTTMVAAAAFGLATVGLATVTVAAARGNRAALAIIFVASALAVAVVGGQVILGRADVEAPVVALLAVFAAEVLASGFLLWEALGGQGDADADRDPAE